MNGKELEHEIYPIELWKNAIPVEIEWGGGQNYGPFVGSYDNTAPNCECTQDPMIWQPTMYRVRLEG